MCGARSVKLERGSAQFCVWERESPPGAAWCSVLTVAGEQCYGPRQIVKPSTSFVMHNSPLDSGEGEETCTDEGRNVSELEQSPPSQRKLISSCEQFFFFPIGLIFPSAKGDLNKRRWKYTV